MENTSDFQIHQLYHDIAICYHSRNIFLNMNYILMI